MLLTTIPKQTKNTPLTSLNFPEIFDNEKSIVEMYLISEKKIIGKSLYCTSLFRKKSRLVLC